MPEPTSRGFNSFALLGCAALAITWLLWAGMPSGDVTNMRKTWQPGFAETVQSLVEANEDPLAVEVLRLRHDLKVQQKIVANLKAAAGSSFPGTIAAHPRAIVPLPSPSTVVARQPPPAQTTETVTAYTLAGVAPAGLKDLPNWSNGMGGSDVTGSSLADENGKIPTDTLKTICPTPSADVLADNTITIYVQNPRTGSLFMSGRLAKYGSGKYIYKWVRTKELSPRPTSSLEAWLDHACKRTPGLKIVAYDSGASPNWWLSNWPASTVLVMTGDEMGRWGLNYRSRYFGPFGTDRESFFYNNMSSPHKHILLPQTIKPWFRQYFDPKQNEAFKYGVDTLHMPLGSRVEFPDIDPETVTPATKRKYIYSLMAAQTDNSRKRLYKTLNETLLIPEDRAFIHMASQWHPELTNDEYIHPEKYAELMQDSIFVPCPRGRALDTFRIYEALESGAIPIIELADGYARGHLPPDYFESPMIFVENWETAPAEMMKLVEDSTALLAKQKAVQAWYDTMMRKVVGTLEELLEARRKLA